jgi:hypothetical protein
LIDWLIVCCHYCFFNVLTCLIFFHIIYLFIDWFC